MTLSIYQVDAFASRLFAGNPAAVVPLEQWLPDETLQNIAAENNLSETAFFKQKEDHYELRWFTPAVEVDLCGHATLATAHVLFEELQYEQEVIRFETRSGLLEVKKEGQSLRMDFPADRMKPVEAPDGLLTSLGIKEARAVFQSDDYMVVVDSEAEVRALNPDLRALREIPCRGVIVTAPGDEVDFVSRFFAPRAGVDEDPVTGSAHTKSTPYWSERLGKKSLKARQLSKRGGDLRCEMQADRVWIYGEAITYLKGEICFD